MSKQDRQSFEEVRQQAEANAEAVIVTVNWEKGTEPKFQTRTGYLESVRALKKDDQKILKGLVRYIVFCFLGTALNLVLICLGWLNPWVGSLSGTILFACGLWGIKLYKSCQKRIRSSEVLLKEWDCT